MAMAVRHGKRAGRSEGFQTAKKVKGKKAKRQPLHEVVPREERPPRGTRVAIPGVGNRTARIPASFPPADTDAEHVGRLPLGPDELEKLRALLQSRRKSALKLARRLVAAEAELEEGRHESHELAERGADRAMEMLLLHEEAKELAEIDRLEAALHRMRAGSYGVCTECGERIAYRRLLALPEASRCLRCENDRRRVPRRV